jgi:uncharacterized protein (TIGR02646 family)
MRVIDKGVEPRSLVEHRATPNSDYANLGNVAKQDLRDALVREQRGLCCYCMTRVEAKRESMKIEHWRSRSNHANLGLTYSNLLAACLGNHDQPAELQHCDTRKGDRDIRFNPAEPMHRIDQRIQFEADGTIASSDAEFNTQLTDVLGLNLPLLRNRRKGVLSGLMDWWSAERARLRGPVPRAQLLRERARRAPAGTGPIAPFDPVAVWWLDQRLTRVAT